MERWRRVDSWMTGTLLLAFNKWFTSAAGVLQTAALVVVIMVIELVYPHLDPHGFWMLYFLTVYSGITQPALAYAGTVAASQNEEIMETVRRLEAEHGEMLTVILEELKQRRAEP